MQHIPLSLRTRLDRTLGTAVGVTVATQLKVGAGTLRALFNVNEIATTGGLIYDAAVAASGATLTAGEIEDLAATTPIAVLPPNCASVAFFNDKALPYVHGLAFVPGTGQSANILYK